MYSVSFHKLVRRDLEEILDYYTSVGGSKLADRFFEEVEQTVEKISQYPERFHFFGTKYRRANLKTFPHHILFEERLTDIKIVVLKHHKRRPQYGTNRK